MIISETSLINSIITEGAKKVISDLRFLELEICKWKTSPTRLMQIAGEKYYGNLHDILDRKRTVIGAGGILTEVTNLPNNLIIDNQYAKVVDQKVNYLVGKPFTISSKNKLYDAILQEYFGKAFMRTAKNVVEDSLNQGVGWLYVYYDDKGNIAFKCIEAYEIKPFWSDSEHNILECAVRLYSVEVYKENETVEVVEKVEVYSTGGIDRYILETGRLIPDVDNPHSNYFKVGEIDYNWDNIPLICFKSNSKEMPLIKRVKSLQDGINLMLSDFENRMQEDARNTILVLENYDGENLGDFRSNLSQYGAVKVRTSDGGKGGVSTLTVEFSSENFQAILKLFKSALIENARGYDAKDDRMSGNPNQMNIQSMYSDIDLDANGMETGFKAAFEEILSFVNAHLKTSKKGDYLKEDFDLTFNRSALINISELIDNCKKSVGMISTKTILKNHPMVEDVEKEMTTMAAEKKKDLEDYGAFPLEAAGGVGNAPGTGNAATTTE